MDRGAWWGYSSRGCKKSDTTERLRLLLHFHHPLQNWFFFFFFEPVPMAAGADIVPPLHSAGAFIYRGVSVRSDGAPWRLSTWFLFPDTFYDGLLVEYSSKA